MGQSDHEPHVDHNAPLQRYYQSLESRIGYRLILGGTRHFGYYEQDTYWPFPFHGPLRAMEDHLFDSLGLESASQVLDAGCGVGHVALHMARKGLRVQGIDVVDHHIQKAQRNIQTHGLEEAVTIRKMDYHNLEQLSSASFDGIYTMETFVHATDPEKVLRGFRRLLRPGGKLALYEYDHNTFHPAMETVNRYAAMPANAQFREGVLERMLTDAGFQDIEVEDLSKNIRPMLRFFFLLAYLPYLLIKLLGLQPWFVNTVAGVEGYRGQDGWRYLAVTARKPADSNPEVSDVVEAEKIR
ncbi:MAG: hypothetical protein M1817_000625 [Caeruleum heppii]|nr:MAG: hypothetical protein M1817_000625 [Caeruleum heppii]